MLTNTSHHLTARGLGFIEEIRNLLQIAGGVKIPQIQIDALQRVGFVLLTELQLGAIVVGRQDVEHCRIRSKFSAGSAFFLEDFAQHRFAMVLLKQCLKLRARLVLCLLLHQLFRLAREAHVKVDLGAAPNVCIAVRCERLFWKGFDWGISRNTLGGFAMRCFPDFDFAYNRCCHGLPLVVNGALNWVLPTRRRASPFSGGYRHRPTVVQLDRSFSRAGKFVAWRASKKLALGHSERASKYTHRGTEHPREGRPSAEVGTSCATRVGLRRSPTRRCGDT